MMVDVHGHYFPDALISVAERVLDPDLVHLTRSRAPGAGFSPEQIIEQLDHAGIDMQVVSPATLLPFVEDRGDAVAAAREMNDIYADLTRAFPARFAAFGVVPLPHVDAAIDEAARCIDELKMVGIALGCSIAGRQLDDPMFEPLWAELDRRGTSIFLHPVGASDASLNAYNLNWMVGAPFEDTLAVLRLVLSGVTTRYPSMRVIVPHMGGTIPFLMTRIDGPVGRSSNIGIELPVSKHLRKIFYDTSNRNPHALRCAVDTLGAEALVLGTDFPYSLDDRLRENVVYVAESGLGPDTIDRILDANASRLLGLGGGA
jgi:aminocarboxymuconate-semialdehyde decarboxylase